MHMVASYRPVNDKTAFPSRRTHAWTWKRRFQVEERMHGLGNGVSKSKNACMGLETAFPGRRTRASAWKRRFQVEERTHGLRDGVSWSKNAWIGFETRSL